MVTLQDTAQRCAMRASHDMKQVLKKVLPRDAITKIRGLMRPPSRSLLSVKPPLPKSIVIDPGDICNLRCPFCPTGSRSSDHRPATMSLGMFKLVLEKIPSLEHVWLFNWGEPLLNPAIFEMIRHAKQRRVSVTTHSHFSLKRTEDFLVDLVQSGLDRLTLSLDGASQASYSRYRVGGDFGLVMSNLRALVRVRDGLRSSTPAITWKFIVNRFNEHEIGTAQEMAADLGIAFETAKMGLSDDVPDSVFDGTIEQRKKHWLPRDTAFVLDRYVGPYRQPLYEGPCNQLFTTLVVSPRGRILPCCWVTNEENAFGDLTREPIRRIWHNSRYAYSRSLFAKTRYSGPAVDTICSQCKNYEKASGQD